MIELFEYMPAVLQALILLGGGVAAFFLLKNKVFNPVWRQIKRYNRAADVLLGYPEIRDASSGEVIQQATPSIGRRVWELEEANIKIAEALMQITENQKSIIRVADDVTDIQYRLSQIESKVETLEFDSVTRDKDEETAESIEMRA